MFTAQDVANLRNITGVGMMDCKTALTECNGNVDKAVEYLREKGMAAVAKKAGRIAAEGVVQSYIHMGGKIGVLVEINCETDFVAKSELFLNFVKDIAMQIAAANPQYVSDEEIPAIELEKEKEVIRAQAINEGKKPEIIEKMMEGRLNKYKAEVCLLNQSFVKDSDMTINQLLNKIVLTIGEKISIRRFVRYEMGEGLTKRQDNFVDEVMSQIKN